MQIALLGPLEARDDAGEQLVVTGTRLRTLLIRLALDAGRPVSADVLIDAIWGESSPAEAANALQTLVSRLRRALGGAAMIAQGPGGYRLGIDAKDVDVNRFEALASEGAAALRSGDPQRAAGVLGEALALWRGPALAEAGEFAAAPAERLHELRLSCLLTRAEAELALGRASGVVAELEALAAEYPLHEQLAGLLVRALAAAGRQADALAVYEQTRARLADELGVDPSPALAQEHLAVLRGEVGPPPPSAQPAAPRTNLRAHLTSFVGRDAEVARIAKSLELNRLVTLVGPGGAGKTRLANEAAARIVDSAADGVWFVELAPVTDPADIAFTVLSSLGIRETHLMEHPAQRGTRDPLTRLTDMLVDKHALIVLDNCEHLIDGCAHVVDTLLARAARLRVLATSREPLGITGEALQVVAPLSRPAVGTPPAEALEFPSVRLFADRAAAAHPDFVVDHTTAARVVEIVQRLDGLPLAIELAAARLRSLPLAEIAERLSDRFRLLTGGSRTAMARHRTLRAVVDWSWDLLAPAERLLAERLSVFPAGATRDSARAVCADADVPAADVADLLSSLVDKSLLVPIADSTRMRMLETIREYGTERLAETGRLTEARSRHAEYFAGLLEQAQPYLTSREQLPWFAVMAAERENILAAQRYFCDSDDADRALAIGVSMAGYAMLLGNHADVPGMLDDALHAAGGHDGQLRSLAEVLHLMNSAMAGEQSGGSVASEQDAGQRLRDLVGSLDDVDVDRHPLVGMLRVAAAYFAEDAERAARFAEQALASRYAWTVASVYMLRANLAENEGDVAAMRADTSQALAGFRALGERWGIASTLRGVALLATYDGDLDGAEAAYAEALEMMSQLGSRDDEAFLRARMAELRLRRGDVAGAREQVAQAEAAAMTTGSLIQAVFVACLAAEVEQESGDRDEARRLRQAATDRATSVSAASPVHSHVLAMVSALSVSFALRDGDIAQSRARAGEALRSALETKDKPIISAAGVALADLLACEGDAERAARLLGASAALRGADDPTAIDIARLTRELTAVLGEGGFAAAYGEGRAMDHTHALELFDDAVGPHDEARSPAVGG